MSKKINKLTKAQEDIIPKYREMGIEIGLRTETGDVDYEMVKELIDRHRVACDLPKTRHWHIYDSPFAAIREWGHTGITTYNALYGQHDINWLNFYLYWRVEHGLIRETEPLVPLMELAKYVGWMWWCTDHVIITKRPTELHLVPRKMSDGSTIKILHNPDGMALRYVDGTGIYKIGATRLAKDYEWIVTDKNRRTLRDYLAIRNTEVRTEALKLLPPSALADAGEVIHTYKCPIGGDYKLLGINLGESRRIYLQGNCPSSGKQFTEAVPPQCTTVPQALSWREMGVLGVSDYTPPEVRT